MRILVVYDSMHGNTEALARAIGAALAGDARVMRAPDATAAALEGLDLLIVGAPTHGGRPMPSVLAFIDRLPPVQGLPVAFFDTRSEGRSARISGEAASAVPHREGVRHAHLPDAASEAHGALPSPAPRPLAGMAGRYHRRRTSAFVRSYGFSSRGGQPGRADYSEMEHQRSHLNTHRTAPRRASRRGRQGM